MVIHILGYHLQGVSRIFGRAAIHPQGKPSSPTPSWLRHWLRLGLARRHSPFGSCRRKCGFLAATSITLGWVHGRVPTTEALGHWLAKIDDAFNQAGWEDNSEQDDPDGLYAQWVDIVGELVGNLKDSGIDAEDLWNPLVRDWRAALPELAHRIDEAGLENYARYNIVQDLENNMLHILRRAGREVDDQPTSGLAAEWEQVQNIDPNNIGTVKLEANWDAPRQHYPIEEQVNFFPIDLRIIHPEFLPHEGRTIQETMYDPRRHHIR